VTTGEDTLLQDITDDLILDTQKVMSITDDMKKIFKAVSENLNILQWLKKHLKGKKIWIILITPIIYTSQDKFVSPYHGSSAGLESTVFIYVKYNFPTQFLTISRVVKGLILKVYM